MKRLELGRKGVVILAVLMAVVVVLTTAVAVNSQGALTPALAAQSRLVHRGGVIRLGHSSNRDGAAYRAATIKIANTGIYLHDNSSHASVGIRALTLANGCDLVVWTDDTAAEEVVNIIAGSDESTARLGIEPGPSGGAGKSTILLWRNGIKWCATDKRFGASSNIWLAITHLRD